ncbi:MAG: hypothetical protein KG003_16150 [Bacteroidetes bacterium]|nr:hypothetical protein [Bacteroidota bacterium]
MRNSWKLVAGLCILAFPNFTCKKLFHKECRNNAELLNGIIIDRLNQDCLFSLNTQKEDIIATQAHWDSLWQNPKFPLQADCQPQVIDFEKESILIFKTVSGEGDVLVLDVSKDDQNHKYIFSIEEVNCSNKIIHHKVAIGSENAVRVPKIPNGWTVEFREED